MRKDTTNPRSFQKNPVTIRLRNRIVTKHYIFGYALYSTGRMLVVGLKEQPETLLKLIRATTLLCCITQLVVVVEAVQFIVPIVLSPILDIKH